MHVKGIHKHDGGFQGNVENIKVNDYENNALVLQFEM